MELLNHSGFQWRYNEHRLQNYVLKQRQLTLEGCLMQLYPQHTSSLVCVCVFYSVVFVVSGCVNRFCSDL